MQQSKKFHSFWEPARLLIERDRDVVLLGTVIYTLEPPCTAEGVVLYPNFSARGRVPRIFLP